MRSPAPSRLSANTLRQICFEQLNTTSNSNPHKHPRSISFPPNHQDQVSVIESRITSLLDGCTNLNHLKRVHAHIYRCGLHYNSYLLTKLIRILTKFNSLMHTYPLLVFSQLRHPNPFTWTAMIRGYAVNGPVSESIAFYRYMRRDGVRPMSFTFSALFMACTSLKDLGLGAQMHGQVFKFGGFESDLLVGNALIDTYVKCGAVDSARKMFDEMPQRDVISATSLIVAYAKSGDIKIAREMFDELLVKDVVVWSAMITSYVQNTMPKEALELFERMQSGGLKADEFTLVGVISACAQLGTTKYAAWIRDIAEESGHGPVRNVVIGSALIDMYSKCGRVDDAYEVFKVMSERNVYTYSSMIVGFAVHGRFDEAMQLFYQMERVGLKPNEVTFVGMLTACSHAGMVEEGRRLFGIMETIYGVTRTADHYACMADLLGRSGHLEEALDLAKSMPLHPHGGIWGALLGACRIHNNPDIAEIAASHLFELEPNSVGNYLVLSNILASAGRWDHVATVRKLMRKKGLRKNPACSWLEGKKGSIHEFFAGNLTHPRSKEIKHVLEDLLDKLKLHGYQPILGSVSYDISDDDKKQLLMTHSEKLALAFGLLTSDSNDSIRIMKNLRICEDCHVFMCGASKITGREIVVRDSMRFHHFRDGSCSCRNFW